MRTHNTTKLDQKRDLQDFRRHLSAPLSEASKEFWAGNSDGAKEGIMEFLSHREQFKDLETKLSQRMVFQLINFSTYLSESTVENLLNVIALASGADSTELDIWIGEKTGIAVTEGIH